MVPAENGQVVLPSFANAAGGATVLRRGDGRFSSLTAAIFEGVCISRDGRITEVNEQFADMYQCRRDDVIGRPVLDFVAPEFHEAIRDRIRTGVEGVFEHRAVRADGTSFEVEVQSRMIEWNGQVVRLSALRDITERQRTDAALRESRARLELIFHNTTDMFLLYAVEPAPAGELQLRLVTLNRAFLEGAARVGYPTTLEAMRGKTYTEIMRGHFERDEAWVTESKAQIQMAIRARRPMQWVDEAMGRTGMYALERTEIPIFGDNGVCGHVLRVLRDVTEQRATQEALRASEQRFRSYFELPIVGVAISSAAQLWTNVNDRLCDMLGYTKAELLGRSWREFTHPDDLAANQVVFERVKAGEVEGYTLEKRFLRKDGRAIPTALSSRCVRRPDGSIDYLVTLVQDISERKRAEAERAAAHAREQRARIDFARKLIASQESERRRIASELHDSLGQNLLLIKNRAQLAMSGTPGAPDLHEQLGGIMQLAVAALAEVRQISHDLRPYQLDQLGLTRALRAMIEGAAAATDLVFDIKLESVDEVFTPDHVIHFYRIVQECLTNVLKHARATRVRLVLERDLHAVRLLVEDDGCGLAEAAAGSGGGFGLLNMAERVQILGGEIELEAGPQGGLRVRVSVPAPERA